ncbi:hypothetical protein QWY84_15500 [Aquisalimonas lutea]|uniref:hypothetical protein n=1 Tax=Aquisalimonas lutea TaxID=1327750 RepID=UPI0025B44388|nr:hypothetical protein [Aquisalimonas lutea]MDN3519023.1 hypothetical protein [Aquisalimonas lutea]
MFEVLLLLVIGGSAAHCGHLVRQYGWRTGFAAWREQTTPMARTFFKAISQLIAFLAEIAPETNRGRRAGLRDSFEMTHPNAIKGDPTGMGHEVVPRHERAIRSKADIVSKNPGEYWSLDEY